MKQIAAVCIVCYCAFLPFSCQKLLTTSLGEPLASDVTISSDLSIEKLLSLGTQYSGSPDIVAAFYQRLSEQIDVTNLSELPVSDRAEIFAMAVMASGIEDTMMDILNTTLESGQNLADISPDTISRALVDLVDSADSAVIGGNLFTALAADPETMETTSPEVLVLAAAATAAAAVNTVVDVETLNNSVNFDTIVGDIDSDSINDSNDAQFAVAATLLSYAVATPEAPATIYTPDSTPTDLLSAMRSSVDTLPDTVSSLFTISDD